MYDDQQHTTVTGFVAFEPIKGIYRLQFSQAALKDKVAYLEKNIYGFKKQMAEQREVAKQMLSDDSNPGIDDANDYIEKTDTAR